MPRVSRVVPWLLVSITVGVLSFATASLLALENSRPEVLDLPEQVSLLYVHAVPLTFGIVGALIIRSQPRNLEGWAFSLLALLTAVHEVLVVFTASHPQSETLARLLGTVSAPVAGLLAVILLLFPDGRPPSPRWRSVVAFICLLTVLGGLAEARGSTVPWGTPNDSASSFVVPLALLAVGVVSLWVRWRNATGQTRQQAKWLMLGASVFGLEFALGFITTLLHAQGDGAGPSYVGNAIFVLTVCMIPAAMGIGIVRHHLYDIDKLLSRTIAYGLLLVAASLLYLASVAVFAGVLASRGHARAVLAVAVTTVAIAAFHPFRRRLVVWADRRVYGTRTDPAELMAGVAAELAAYRSPEDGMTGLADAARRATRARGALVRIELPDGERHVVMAGDASAAGARTSVSIRVDGAVVGMIAVVDPSRHSDGLTLLSRLASLAGPAAADMRTIAELRQLRSRIQAGNADLAASRSRLAHAEAKERAHLHQIVQSEVLPAVLNLRQRLPAIEAIRAGDVRGGALDDAARQSGELADSIRGLAHDVLPPVLADRGLAAALRGHIRRLGADVTLAGPESHRLPESIEAALYTCGRILVDAAADTAVPVSLALAVSSGDVQLTATSPNAVDDVGDNLRQHAMRLVGDRLAVLGGAVTTTRSAGRVTEIRCHVPLNAEPGAAESPSSAAL